MGIGTSVSVYLKYNSTHDKLLINPVGFNSEAVTTSTDTITITDHGFKTGDKVFYESDLNITGLSEGSYFVYRIDDDNFNLTNTQYDLSTPPSCKFWFYRWFFSRTFSDQLRLDVVRNNNLVFNTSDTSLSGYNFNSTMIRKLRIHLFLLEHLTHSALLV